MGWTAAGARATAEPSAAGFHRGCARDVLPLRDAAQRADPAPPPAVASVAVAPAGVAACPDSGFRVVILDDHHSVPIYTRTASNATGLRSTLRQRRPLRGRGRTVVLRLAPARGYSSDRAGRPWPRGVPRHGLPRGAEILQARVCNV